MSGIDFRQSQRELTDHIRQPENPGPENFEPRRLKIYRELFYNNIEGFVSGAFPVLRSLISDEDWHAMVRDFMASYRCHTPYFLEISQEFLGYLQQREPSPVDLPFMLELAHYEWTELALDVSEEEIDWPPFELQGELLDLNLTLSPLAWSLGYRFAVHRIGSEYQPQQPEDNPTYIVVYRDRQDAVQFLEINAATARLIELCSQPESLSLRQVVEQLATELGYPDSDQLLAFGSELAADLCQRDILYPY